MTRLSPDLAEEFAGQEDEIERLMRENARFEALAHRAHALWLQIHEIERGLGAEDDALRGLKTERLGVLDEVALILRGGKNAPSQARRDGRF
ncbi:MAG: GTP-binding protein [Pseudomonadota bacterium]